MKRYKIELHESELLLTDNLITYKTDVNGIIDDFKKMNIPIELIKSINEMPEDRDVIYDKI